MSRREGQWIIVVSLILLAFLEVLWGFQATSTESTRNQLARAQCKDFLSCSECALARSNCIWCVSSSTCLPLEQRSTCDDVERGACSPVLLFHIPAVFRVIYVGKKSGGPEALIQLHLALRHCGFQSSLETRKRQVGKKLLPFFQNAYEAQFRKAGGVFMRQSHDYRSFLESARSSDIIILTETWPCQRGLRFDSQRATRQLQYQLTVQDRRFTYDISHLYIPDALPEECAVFSHTHYLTHTVLNQSSKSTLAPYVTPHIVELAERSVQRKRTIILYDGDANINPEQFHTSLRSLLVKAASIKPHRLYKLYSEAICVIDFGMPGSERLVLEASLFGTPIIVNDELNGGDTVDFPIPQRFRVRGRNYTQLNVLVKELVKITGTPKWSALIEEFSQFRSYVKRLQPQFLKSVRKYFSDSAHFVVDTAVMTRRDIKFFVVSAFVHLPFCLISLRFQNEAEKQRFNSSEQSFINAIHSHYLTSSLSLIVGSQEAVITPPHVLFRIGVVNRSCFIASYSFLSTVAVVVDLSLDDEFRIAGCFQIAVAKGSRRKARARQVIVPEQWYRSVVVTSSDKLSTLGHLELDPLWNDLKNFV